MNIYTLHITVYSPLFLGAIFVGLSFVLQLWFTKKANQSANLFLSLALLTMVLWIIFLLGTDLGLGSYFPQWNWLPLQFSLALGPLIYLYVLKTIRPEHKFRGRDWLHFIPMLLQQGVFILEARQGAVTGLPVYGTHMFQQLGMVLQPATFVSVVIYLSGCFRLIERFYQQIAFDYLSDRYRNDLRWLQRILQRFGLVWLLWIPYTAVDYLYDHHQSGLHPYYSLYLLLMVMMIWTAAKIFSRPEAEKHASQHPIPKLPPSAALRQKAAWLKNTVNENRYYQDPELSLGSLSEKLGLSTHDLSRILNSGLKKTFNDFINEYRVQDAARKMHDPGYDHITLLGIAYESGFSAQSTFSRIFKQATGKTPLEYKNDLKKDFPSYNLRSFVLSPAVISNHETTLRWHGEKLNRNYMFKNYFKIAWRNLTRNKSYAAINITGLSIGIAACLLIFLLVQFETSFDNFHSKGKSVYRVITATKGSNGLDLGSGVPFPTSEGLRIDYPQLKYVAALLKYGALYSVSGANDKQAVKKFREEDAYYCEPQFFNIFDFGWLAGDKKTALTEPNTAVLTQDEADKFFGDWHKAIGKLIRLNNTDDFKITGVLKNFPDNTDFPTKIVVSYATLRQKDSPFVGNMNDWVSTHGSHNVFVVLPPGVSEAQFNKELTAFVKKHKPADRVKEGMQLQPLSDMHYNDKVSIYSHHPFNKELINAISLIGVFLLMIACVNFINLATAQAVNRSKEVGIRKVIGSNRNQLVLQFLSETFIITLFAVIIAIFIAIGVMQALNQLLAIKLTGAMLYQPLVVAFISGSIVCVTLLSGFYPAIILSGFNPITALKNRIAVSKSSGLSLRRALVILQFCIAQVLVIGTLVIISQMNYFRSQSLGFDKDAVMNVPFPNDSINLLKLPALRDQLLQLSGVKNVSYSFASPSDNGGWSTGFKYNNASKDVDFETYLKWADADYFNLYKMEFLAGQAYKKSDTVTGYVVNETLLNKLGVHNPKDAIGKYIGLWDDAKLKRPIVGVVKDFNVSSLKTVIPPVLMASRTDNFQVINIRVQPVNFSNTLASVQKIWTSTFPDGVYNYQFLNDKIENFYRSDDRLSTLYKIFAGIAIFISCLGLYGLVSFMAVQRTKEVGIRKTLGASVGHIVYLFSKEFTLLIIIAFLISAPIGYYFMHKWLQDFAYKISIGPGIFVLAIIASVAIAWVTVGYKALKAALTNPIESLRSE